MTAADLAGEHLAALDHMVAARGLARLAALGITGPTYVAAGCIGLAHVEIAGDTYQPMPGGALAYIVPVLGDGELVDLCAWLVDHPSRWALRLGVGFALGADAIRGAMWPSAGPLDLHPHPLAWLRGGCRGACILDQSRAWQELGDIAAVVAQDVDHGRAVERMLTPPPWPRPRVLVRRPAAGERTAALAACQIEAVS